MDGKWKVQEDFSRLCSGCLIREISHIPVCVERLFTDWEAARAAKMGPRRVRAFAAARSSLKKLAHQLHLINAATPDTHIETLSRDAIRPTLPSGTLHCSVSHDDRFVVVAADPKPLGVDVEEISHRVLRGVRLFMSLEEYDRALMAGLEAAHAVTRAWSAKEVMAKALNLNLAQAWQEVRIVKLAAEKSVVRTRGKDLEVVHREIAGHVFSIGTWVWSKS